MDLVSSIRKEGSRGGVDFKWSDVESSSHRENYLGHSLMAPVGRWQKNRDLGWYAKADDAQGVEGETEEEKKQRLRKEEIRKIKEAEEDALARALGLPVKERTSDANATPVGQREIKQAVDEVEVEKQEPEGQGRFGGFVGAVGDEKRLVLDDDMEGEAPGGLVGASKRRSRRDDDDDENRKPRHRHRHHHSRRDRPRSSSRGNRHERSDRYRHRDRNDRSRSPRRGADNRESERARKISRERRYRNEGNSRERRRRSPGDRQRERSRDRDYSRERRRRDRSPDRRQTGKGGRGSD